TPQAAPGSRRSSVARSSADALTRTEDLSRETAGRLPGVHPVESQTSTWWPPDRRPSLSRTPLVPARATARSDRRRGPSPGPRLLDRVQLEVGHHGGARLHLRRTDLRDVPVGRGDELSRLLRLVEPVLVDAVGPGDQGDRGELPVDLDD